VKFTPKYRVSYKGVFYPGGVPFDIDPADQREMARHGALKKDTPEPEPPAKKPGRPRKAVGE